MATDWGNAFSDFRQFKRFKNLTWKDYLVPIKRIAEDTVTPYILRMRALYHYGRIQEADLYAHFSPVEFIMDNKLLKTEDFKDALGDENIWDRLKKLGGDRFYRVEYGDPDDIESMSAEELRTI